MESETKERVALALAHHRLVSPTLACDFCLHQLQHLPDLLPLYPTAQWSNERLMRFLKELLKNKAHHRHPSPAPLPTRP